MKTKLTKEQAQSIIDNVLSKTTGGLYGPVVVRKTSPNIIKYTYGICRNWKLKLVSSSDGQFTGGYSQEIYTANDTEFHLFSFQDGELYEYEKRVKSD